MFINKKRENRVLCKVSSTSSSGCLSYLWLADMKGSLPKLDLKVHPLFNFALDYFGGNLCPSSKHLFGDHPYGKHIHMTIIRYWRSSVLYVKTFYLNCDCFPLVQSKFTSNNILLVFFKDKWGEREICETIQRIR